MKLTLYQGNSLDALKRLPEESIDCIVTSSPYYGLRDYSSVETISAKTEQAVIDLTDTKIREYEKKYPGHKFYHNEPMADKEKKGYFCTIRIDIDAVWGADPECEHEWKEISNGRTDGTGFERNRKGLNKAAEMSDGNKRNSVTGLAPVLHDSNVCFKCHAWKGQLGLEPTYKMFIEHLLLITNELKRVLKPTGTLFWNMGDSYASFGGPLRHFGYIDPKYGNNKGGFFVEPITPKSLMMIPERLAMGMIDQGWILRNKLIWYKPNGMPSSVRDRFSNKWEYIFFFSKNRKYYFDLDSVRKPLSEGSIKRISQKNIPNQFQSGKSMEYGKTSQNMSIPKILNNMKTKHDMAVNRNGRYDDPLHTKPYNENGANPGDVLKEPAVRHKSWVSNAGHNFTHERKYDPDADGGDFFSIPTMPHPFAHFAVYPETLIEPLIKAGCPKDGIVLDPFNGSGTTMLVARNLGRSAIGIDVNPIYSEIVKKRLQWGMGLDIEHEIIEKVLS
jgi:DNA modification methylase